MKAIEILSRKPFWAVDGNRACSPGWHGGLVEVFDDGRIEFASESGKSVCENDVIYLVQAINAVREAAGMSPLFVEPEPNAER